MGGDELPLVSISVTAYQHAPFLGACLDSLLEQRCDFPFEILLGEDESDDGTRGIAEQYAMAYPDRIRLFLHRRDQVMMIDGRPTGRFNLLHNLSQARGRYLCHIDGDDRWTDPDRLALMVRHMEADPRLSMAFHNAINVWPDGRQLPYFSSSGLKLSFTLEDIAAKNFIPTSGVIWRWNGLHSLPRVLKEAPFADWVMHIHFAMLGSIGYVDRCMSIRNVHALGNMSRMDELRTCRTIAHSYEIMFQQAGNRIGSTAFMRWAKQLEQGFEIALRAGDEASALWFLKHAARIPSAWLPMRQRFRWRMLLGFPRFMTWYHSWRTPGE